MKEQKNLINEERYNELTENTPCVIQFTADWCGPCKSLKTILNQVTEDFNVGYYLVDISQNAEFARKKSILSIPYVEMFSGGQLRESFIGSMPKNQVEELMSVYFAQ